MESSLLFAYMMIGIYAVVPIYFGSFASLKRPQSAKKPLKTEKDGSDSDDEESVHSEPLSSSDAWMFPVFGSSVLFGLYLIFRYLDKDLINLLLSSYFAAAGIAGSTVMFTRAAKAFIATKNLTKYKLALTTNQTSPTVKSIFSLSFTAINVVMLGLSTLMACTYVFTKHWFLSNILGLAFSFNAIVLIGLDSFKTGAILLSGLFVYDVFWVFGTDVMVTVAKSFDAPIKILWPKSLALFPTGESAFTMLGLGDIVIPGIFVALALRYDLHRYHVKHPNTPYSRRFSSFPKPYFVATLAAYVAGLTTTICVMHTFKAAQPALLYLSPACLLAIGSVAIVQGEISEVLGYSEETEEDSKESKDGKEEDQSIENTNDDGKSSATVQTNENLRQRK